VARAWGDAWGDAWGNAWGTAETAFADERAAIEKQFADNWSSTTVRYQNVRFEQPAGAWVALSIKPGRGRQADSSHNPRHRYAGVIIIDVFTPEGGGTEAAKALVDTAEAIFRQKIFSFGNSGEIICRTPSLHTVGVRDGWNHHSLWTPYHRDKIF